MSYPWGTTIWREGADMTHNRANETVPNPNGCRWCGVDRDKHLQRWDPTVEWHVWVEPTSAQRKRRMLERRARPNASLSMLAS